MSSHTMQSKSGLPAQFWVIWGVELWERFGDSPALFLPASIEKFSFGHYHEITGKRVGFQLSPRWKMLPDGPWSVLFEATERKPSEKVSFKVTIDREKGLLFKGKLTLSLSGKDQGTNILVEVEGNKEGGLADVNDEFIETIMRSIIRESVQELNQLPNGGTALAPASISSEDGVDHMAPLAVAAGVFSAGMALSLWFWRRK